MELRHPVKNINISQLFGKDFLFYNSATGKTESFYGYYGLKGHPGIDYSCSIGTPVYASHPGRVLYAGYDDTNGNLIQVWNEENNFKTLYGHNSEMKVKAGDMVEAGQLISLSGNTGAGTGPHLHWGYKETKEGGNTKYPDNGYNGCIDQLPFTTLDYLGNKLSKYMTFKKIKNEPHIWMCNEIKKTRVMVIDMPTLFILNDGNYDEVNQLDMYQIAGTIALFERVIN